MADTPFPLSSFFSSSSFPSSSPSSPSLVFFLFPPDPNWFYFASILLINCRSPRSTTALHCLSGCSPSAVASPAAVRQPSPLFLRTCNSKLAAAAIAPSTIQSRLAIAVAVARQACRRRPPQSQPLSPLPSPPRSTFTPYNSSPSQLPAVVTITTLCRLVAASLPLSLSPNLSLSLSLSHRHHPGLTFPSPSRRCRRITVATTAHWPASPPAN